MATRQLDLGTSHRLRVTWGLIVRLAVSLADAHGEWASESSKTWPGGMSQVGGKVSLGPCLGLGRQAAGNLRIQQAEMRL